MGDTNTDVKVEETKVQDTSTEQPGTAPDTSKNEEAEVLDDSEKRTIPYARFKEILDSKKDAERKLKNMESLAEQKVREKEVQLQSFYESEIARMQRMAQEQQYSAPVDADANAFTRVMESMQREIETLKGTVTNLNVQNESQKIMSKVMELKDVFPMADEEHTLAIKKLRPDLTLEECVEMSHSKFDNLIKGKVNAIIKAKAEAAKKQVVTAETTIPFKMEEKPKTMKEAKEKFMEYMRLRQKK